VTTVHRLCAVLVLLFTLAGTAFAHEVQPCYLELAETSPGRYDVMWKAPRRGMLHLRVTPQLPTNTRAISAPAKHHTWNALVSRWSITCDGDLSGGTIRVAGLERTVNDVLVQIRRIDAPGITLRLTPSSPSALVPSDPTFWDTARTYLVLGVEHILGGIDHLLFVLALLLCVSSTRTLLAAVTAFTVAHSITLALATIGMVHVPGPPVEAFISLSIVFLATEIVHARAGRPGLTHRHPWTVAFVFGLIHGLGFASALRDVGLPEDRIPLALLQFNVGVELGQLAFVLACVVAIRLFRALAKPPEWAWRVPAYGIGAVAAFWTIQRVASFWSAPGA